MGRQKVFVIIVDNVILDDCYGSLKQVAENAGFSYWTVQRKWAKKRFYIRDGKTIRELSLTKIKGRGRKK